MRQIPSLSEWINKTVTCSTCLKSYIIEEGDKITGGYKSHKRGVVPLKFDMPCGHYISLDEVKKQNDLKHE